MTADELIVAVREFANLASAAEDGEDAQILRRLNIEQGLYLTTLLEKAKGQHQQSTLSITVTAATRYPIPTRAIAAGIKMVEGVDAAGVSWMLYEYADEKAARFGRFTDRNGHFYVEGNELVFYAAPPAGTLKVTYSRRMSTLVAVASARAITAINTGTKTVTIAAAPASFTGLTSMDLVKGTEHFDIHGMDLACTAIGASGTSVIFSATLPTNLAVGDYVCIPKETPVCQAPVELHSVLALRAAYVWSRAKNDPIANVLEGDLKDAAAMAATLIEPRMEQEGPIVNPYAPGFARWRGVRGSSGS